MQLFTRVFSYSAVLLFGVAVWIALIAAVVIVSHWERVLEFLLGAWRARSPESPSPISLPFPLTHD